MVAEPGERFNACEYLLDRRVVPATHPDPNWITHWLVTHSFVPGIGDLRRQVRAARTIAPS